MEASLSFQAGKPILSDTEYDELKQKLQKKNSKVVQQVCYSSIYHQSLYISWNRRDLRLGFCFDKPCFEVRVLLAVSSPGLLCCSISPNPAMK